MQLNEKGQLIVFKFFKSINVIQEKIIEKSSAMSQLYQIYMYFVLIH